MSDKTRVAWKSYWGSKRWPQKVAVVVSVLLAVFQVYTALMGAFDSLIQRAIHLGLGMILTFLIYPGWIKGKGGLDPSWLDWLMILFFSGASAYLLLNYNWLMEERFPFITPVIWYEKVLGVGTILLVLEATRRLFNKGLLVVVVVFLIYPLIGPYLPYAFHTSPYTWVTLIDFNYLSLSGIYGIPLGVSATEIALFIIFGAILMHSGGSMLFNNLAVAMTGKMVGGPAKVAVVASSLLGTITGSGAANVATTGAVTIPMMKRAGYRPEFAAAVEATASTGGQIMPPVMGAAAFVMAAFSGIPYSTIIYYSIFPAILYYLSLFITVDLEARRTKLPGMESESTVRDTMKDYGHMLIPLIILVYFLVSGYTPRLAGGLGVVTAVAAAQIRRTTRMNLAGLLRALEDGAKGMLIVMISTAAAGIIVGSVDLTGLGNRLGTVFIDMAHGSLFIGLIMAMLIALVLGTGMPTTPAYIVQVATVIPALMAMGLPMHVAHLFAFYFSCLSLITPPVAAAAYTAAAIADSDGWKTGWTATRLALVGFVVPFMFAYDQTLLLQGAFWEVVLDVSTACVGTACFAMAGVGFLRRSFKWYERFLAFAAGFLLVAPNKNASLIGLFLMGMLIVIQFPSLVRRGRNRVSLTM
jgi:TRAP transporter 4TM/12TM fusion protein